MSTSYPHDAQTVVELLTEYFRHQAKAEMVALLESATAEIEHSHHDNWNGGQEFYSLFLSVPLAVFAPLDGRVEEVQKEIASKLPTLFPDADTDPHFLQSVVIKPQVAVKGRTAPKTATSAAVERIWGGGKVRVFLSHLSKHKAEVAALKNCLGVYGIAAFVAHEDVEPTLEWQREIEAALDTMHVLVAVLTPGFAESLWADQEVGYALGKGVKTIPVKAGALPHGFLGKQQAMPGDLAKPYDLARRIAALIFRDSNLQPRMQDALVNALAASNSWATTDIITGLLTQCDRFSVEQVGLISKALKENSQVWAARKAAPTLKALVTKFTPAKVEDDVPF